MKKQISINFSFNFSSVPQNKDSRGNYRWQKFYVPPVKIMC